MEYYVKISIKTIIGRDHLLKYYFILLLLLLTLFTGCNNGNVVEHDYTFQGESEHWSAEYIVEGKGTFTEKEGKTKYDSEVSSKMTVTYNGSLEEISSIENLKYEYQSSVSGGGEGVAIENSDELIEVTIQWDGKTEKFELRNVGKIK